MTGDVVSREDVQRQSFCI